MITLGATYLIGGIFIQKYKLWANRLICIISILHILIVWIFMLLVPSSLNLGSSPIPLTIFSILAAILWTIPFGLLTFFLNKKIIINHFE